MRVGIITPEYPPAVSGGGEISVKLLADQLTSAGLDVQVFSFDGGEAPIVDGVPVTRFDLPTQKVMEVANVWALQALLRNREELRNCDILHGYNVTLHPAVGHVSRLIDVPSVATLNSYVLLQKSAFGVSPKLSQRLYELIAMPTTARILRYGVKQINQFITLSEASRQIYRANGFDETPIDVIPNMLDPSFETPEVISDNDQYILLYVGSLIQEKGVSYLIRSVSRLPDDVLLRIVGSGEKSGELRQLAEDIGVSDRVEFVGRVPYEEVRKQYALADCFVHPGVWPEPFGRTILEAMQAGLPVVCTDIGGPAEVVPQDELRCPPRDPSSLADTIRVARRNNAIGEENRRYVYDKYTPDRIVNEIKELYARVQRGATE